MIDRKIKIKDKWYEYIACESQLKMNFAFSDKNSMDYIIKFDIKYLNDIKLIFIKSLKPEIDVSEGKFEIRLGNIKSYGCFITNIDFYSEDHFDVNITCDYFIPMSVLEIRDEKLDQILNNN